MIKKLKASLADFREKHKNERFFKAKILIAVLVIAIFAVRAFDIGSSRETETETAAETENSEETEEEEPVTIEKILYDNKAHIIIFVGLTAALAVVKLNQKHKIKESK